ncbi:PREDICTED: uncharacterized protein LOC108561622 [Nicrophorus vespilloides]|uniref:Uncharacterized protein LOC108561622 n=1 Tax=Nicrophorus vespilloides TaxID=110193 RepID=A0ABM1MKN6_NICVS|nr:PREDICTED: uncharacterized protein LOC108561622 [Nicrophorus vespilloides]XP_017775136.1 PREDICTED: uncharacterized protein LOC108561622 [Nicrophorus vespilloides]
MKFALVLLGLAALATADAASCDPTKCVLPDCRCPGTDIPGGMDIQNIPQMVYFTFDDAITAENFGKYESSFFHRKNPDGCPMSATYFVSHEYTDYSKLHQLHAHGHEIALHSITHTSMSDYWRNLPVEEHLKEFGGEKVLISKFGNIPEEDIKGLRLPLLQLSGNNSFIAANQIGLSYDCSWPSRQFVEPGLWPYTLDSGATHDCPLGDCPTNLQLPGFWVSPMVMWFDDINVSCSMVDACTNIPDDVDGIFKFMLRNFELQYKGNKSPFGVYMHAAWFGQRANAFEAFNKFLDHLESLDDVYVTSVGRGLNWVKNPKNLQNLDDVWSKCQHTYEPVCNSQVCKLFKGVEERYMTVCGECPNEYPWLENPLGD